METLDFPPGTVIYKKGELANFVYVLKSGRVKLSIGLHDFIVTSEEPVAFGLEAVSGAPYSEDCVAVTEVKLIRCEKGEFQDVYQNTELGKRSLEEFMRRTAKALGWI